jgi:ribonuclease-3
LTRHADRIGLQVIHPEQYAINMSSRSADADLADAFEALIAAIYIDAGIDEAKAFVLREFTDELNQTRERKYG